MPLHSARSASVRATECSPRHVLKTTVASLLLPCRWLHCLGLVEDQVRETLSRLSVQLQARRCLPRRRSSRQTLGGASTASVSVLSSANAVKHQVSLVNCFEILMAPIDTSSWHQSLGHRCRPPAESEQINQKFQHLRDAVPILKMLITCCSDVMCPTL